MEHQCFSDIHHADPVTVNQGKTNTTRKTSRETPDRSASSQLPVQTLSQPHVSTYMQRMGQPVRHTGDVYTTTSRKAQAILLENISFVQVIMTRITFAHDYFRRRQCIITLFFCSLKELQHDLSKHLYTQHSIQSIYESHDMTANHTLVCESQFQI